MSPEWTLKRLAHPTGFEPVTSAFGGQIRRTAEAICPICTPSLSIAAPRTESTSACRERLLSIAHDCQSRGGGMARSRGRPIKRTIRRRELREIVPLADSTIYEMEQRGEFPRRFALSPRCVAWDLAEVEAWLAARRSSSIARAPHPDVRKRRTRPVKAPDRPQRPASVEE